MVLLLRPSYLYLVRVYVYDEVYPCTRVGCRCIVGCVSTVPGSSPGGVRTRSLFRFLLSCAVPRALAFPGISSLALFRLFALGLCLIECDGITTPYQVAPTKERYSYSVPLG